MRTTKRKSPGEKKENAAKAPRNNKSGKEEVLLPQVDLESKVNDRVLERLIEGNNAARDV